ncbi:MAG: serine hydrolase [Cyclonatronaceae bacterium]
MKNASNPSITSLSLPGRAVLLTILVMPLMTVALSAEAASTRAEETRAGQLQEELETLIGDFNGDAGIYVRNLTTGEEFAVNPDTVYPTASMVKVPIMGKLFQDMEDGEFAYDEEVPYDTVYSYRYSEDMINRMPHGSLVPLNRLIYLMMCMSDNTSSIWLQDKAGGGLGINAWLADNGFEEIRVNSRTEGRQADFRTYGWGQSTPRELTELMVRIFEGKLVSPLASDKMYRIMKANMWDAEGLSQIPPYVNYASKGGAVSRARSETIVVNAPSGDYAYTVMTKNQEDERYEYDNDGYVLKRMVGRMLWNYFEPAHDWEPHPDYPKTW